MIRRLALTLFAAACACSSQQGLGGNDSDGVKGGDYTFQVTVDDSSFTPSILKAQNDANVTLTVTNVGTRQHDFVVDCQGSACFPDAATIPPLAPDASATVTFQTPDTEGIYDVRSDLPGDTQSGQFVVQ